MNCKIGESVVISFLSQRRKGFEKFLIQRLDLILKMILRSLAPNDRRIMYFTHGLIHLLILYRNDFHTRLLITPEAVSQIRKASSAPASRRQSVVVRHDWL